VVQGNFPWVLVKFTADNDMVGYGEAYAADRPEAEGAYLFEVAKINAVMVGCWEEKPSTALCQFMNEFTTAPTKMLVISGNWKNAPTKAPKTTRAIAVTGRSFCFC